jgi:hypothetical protein
MLNRRNLIGSLCVAGTVKALGLDQPASSAAPVDLGKRPNSAQIDEWVTSALLDAAVENAVGGVLIMSRFVEPIWYLIDPISWRPNDGQLGYRPVVVPSGFVTDLASIPRIFWSLLPPDGEYAYAAVIHDYLYWVQTIARQDADEIFKFCMQDFHVNSYTIATIYDAVRLGGKSSWDSNAALKRRGERRILTRYPNDPTIRWSDWSRDPRNFL